MPRGKFPVGTQDPVLKRVKVLFPRHGEYALVVSRPLGQGLTRLPRKPQHRPPVYLLQPSHRHMPMDPTQNSPRPAFQRINDPRQLARLLYDDVHPGFVGIPAHPPVAQGRPQPTGVDQELVHI